MLVSILTVLVATPLVFGQFEGPLAQLGKRPGSCPSLPDFSYCEMSCYADFHCAGTQKCCRTACGGSFCINPVTAPVATAEEKPGVCPKPSGPWVCSSRCKVDSDCRGKKKCCRNRCGALACVNPEEDIENEILMNI